MFPAREFRGPLRLFAKIKIPTLIILCSLEEYLINDKVTPQELLSVFNSFRRSKSYATFIMPNSDHSYTDNEEEFGKVILNWIKGLV